MPTQRTLNIQLAICLLGLTSFAVSQTPAQQTEKQSNQPTDNLKLQTQTILRHDKNCPCCSGTKFVYRYRTPSWVKQHGKKLQEYAPDRTNAEVLQMLDGLLRPEYGKDLWFRKQPHRLDVVAAFFGHAALGSPTLVRQYETRLAATSGFERRLLLQILRILSLIHI